MKQMKLIKLSIKNFKGIKNLVLDAGGDNLFIFGDNATGKTTIFDAFLWLLFDKDSQNKKDFEIKTLSPEGKTIHYLDHEVEGVFSIAGKQLALRKVYAEKWTKQRGSTQKVFSGHTTDYFIDGVPVKKNEYTTRITQIINEDAFRLLTNPAHFNEQLHWQDRRKILLEVCGDLTDEEVIASDKSLAQLPDILQGRKLEDLRKIITARRTEINKELEKIPVRIDEADRGLPDISGLDEGVIGNHLLHLRAELRQKQDSLLRIQSGGEVAEKRRQLTVVETELLQLANQHRLVFDAKLDAKRKLLGEVKGRIADLKADIAGFKRRMEAIASEAVRLEEQIRHKRGTWFEVDSWRFEESLDTVCPTCGQALPEEKLAEAREKALAAFNRDKSELLEKISAEGKALKAELESLQAENTKLVNQCNLAEERLAKEEHDAEALQKEIEDVISISQPLAEDPAYKKKLTEKESLEKAIAQLQEDNWTAVENLKSEIEELGRRIEVLESDALKFKLREQGLKRIEELKAQEKALAAEYESLESQLYLTERFIRSKVAMLEEKINSRFKLARFKLFDVQVNGAVVECCETLYGGVPYSGGLNNGARINVGLDIINTLADYYGFAPPVFIDNAEAVTELMPTRGQLIRLIVSEPDKALRVEREKVMKEAV